MILLVALFLGLLAGWCLARWHGRPYRVPEPKHLWLVPAAFAPQLAAAYWPAARALVPPMVAATLVPVSLLGLLAFVWLNRQIPGMPVVMVGLVLNLMVIVANGGWMPISPETASQLPGGSPPEAAVTGTRVDEKNILLRAEDTRLEILADRFLLADVAGYRAALSLGDLFVAAGAFWLLASPPRAPNPQRSENAEI